MGRDALHLAALAGFGHEGGRRAGNAILPPMQGTAMARAAAPRPALPLAARWGSRSHCLWRHCACRKGWGTGESACHAG